MPLDKARIQGFGSDGPAPDKIPECPEGHELQLWAARSGKCDGCHKKVQTGEQVMDCRRCNWYLCNVCCPQSKAQESSLWGAISSLPFYVLDDMSEMATDIETFVSASVFDGADKDPDGQVRPAQGQEGAVSPRQKAESAQVVTEFCEKYPATRVVPNEADLDMFWTKCSLLHPRSIADAIYDQLSFSGGDNEWQPRLRALYALEHLHVKGGIGKETARLVMHSAKGLLQHLTEVSQCSQKAEQVIAALRGAKAGEGGEPGRTVDEFVAGTGAAQKAPGSASSGGQAASSATARPKAGATKPTDLLDVTAPPVAAAPKPASQAAQDLLDLPLSEPVASTSAPPKQGTNDLLDLTVALAAPAVQLATAPNTTAGATAGPPPAAVSPDVRLADLYALYPQSNAPLPAPMGAKDSSSAYNFLPPPSQPFGPDAAASRPSRSSPQAGGSSTGTNPERSSPGESPDTPQPKEKGLESLLSDALAGLGNLGGAPAVNQPPRQTGSMHRALAAAH